MISNPYCAVLAPLCYKHYKLLKDGMQIDVIRYELIFGEFSFIDFYCCEVVSSSNTRRNGA